jgi:hypothetical protein
VGISKTFQWCKRHHRTRNLSTNPSAPYSVPLRLRKSATLPPRRRTRLRDFQSRRGRCHHSTRSWASRYTGCSWEYHFGNQVFCGFSSQALLPASPLVPPRALPTWWLSSSKAPGCAVMFRRRKSRAAQTPSGPADAREAPISFTATAGGGHPGPAGSWCISAWGGHRRCGQPAGGC